MSRFQRNPKAEAVLAALCDHLGAMMKTQAVKFPYLVDVIATRVLGEPITDARYGTWEHGVVCEPLFAMLDHSAKAGGFHVERPPYTETQSVQRDTELPPEDSLGEAERAIVQYVADEYGGLSADELGLLTKRMNPDVPATAWGNNRAANVNEDAYDRLTDAYQEMASTLDGLDPRTLWENVRPLPDDPRDWV